MKYPKINTIWKRDPNNKNHIIEGDFSMPEFENIKNWHITEKVDGTNIRISFNDGIVKFDGKTDNAQIPAHLMNALIPMFKPWKFIAAFSKTTENTDGSTVTTIPQRIILYGEGYGIKIQNGGLYRPDAGFILFDVFVDGMWLTRESVEDIGQKFDIPVVPTIGIMTCEEAINFVKSKPASKCALKERVAEGIVARSHPLVLFRNGSPVMFKIKVKDYQDLVRS